MNKPWVGYLGSFLVLSAGVLQIIDNRLIIGSILIFMAVIGVIVKFYLNKQKES